MPYSRYDITLCTVMCSIMNVRSFISLGWSYVNLPLM